MESETDKIFLQILREEKNITNFLDAFFGFLYRCTDFYVESTPEQRLGFPPGIAEKLALSALRKWQNIYQSSTEEISAKHSEKGAHAPDIQSNSQNPETVEVPQAVEEVEVETNKETDLNDSEVPAGSFDDDGRITSQLSDSYNGAVRENYTWSQTITDLDVLVKIPSCLKAAKDLRVDLQTQQVKVEARSSVLSSDESTDKNENLPEWTTIFAGELCYKTKKDESVWSVIPGHHVAIHLEKAAERWWEALVVGESKIELNKIDCTRNLDELGSMEQMKVQELMWNHQQKLLGKPTSEQIKMQNILKEAWNAKGSPFQGTPFDPSILKFN